MIRSLAREQLRSQKRYIALSAVIIAIAVGFASYGMTISHAVRQAENALGSALGWDSQWWSSVALNVEPDGAPIDDAFADLDLVQWEAFNAALDEAAVDGIDAVAVHSNAWLSLDPVGGTATALRGNVGWDTLIMEGRAPQSGEVAVTKAAAIDLGIEIGDTIDATNPREGSTAAKELTVVGFTYSRIAVAGIFVDFASGFLVAWDDVPELFALSAPVADSADNEEPFQFPADAMLWWDGESPAIVEMLASPPEDQSAIPAYHEPIGTVGWTVAGVVATVVGLVAMSFAVGRAQAQSRSTWLATARALGATRTHIVATTFVEALVVGGIGGLVGYVLGAIGATAHVQIVHSAVPGAPIATSVGLVPWALAAAIGLGLVLSVIIAGVPAFWAARVQPVVALKPEGDVTTAQVSRRVRFAPVAIAWALAAITCVAVPTRSVSGGTFAITVAAVLVCLILTPVVINEILRWVLPRVGAWLARRSDPVAMIAGDSMAARPRQLTVPGFVLGLVVAGVIIAGAVTTTFTFFENAKDFQNDPLMPGLAPQVPGWAPLVTVGLVALAVLIGTTISVVTHDVTRAERSTREALGVTPRQTRAAAGLAHRFGVGLGAVVGWGVGIVSGTALTLGAIEPGSGLPPNLNILWLIATLFVGSVAVLVIALAGASLGSLVVGRSASVDRDTRAAQKV